MGNQRQYNPTGGFFQYLFERHPDWEAVYINGVHAKVVRSITDKECRHSSLPLYSDTSDMYFKVGRSGQIIQARFYIDRSSVLDFDWSHRHCNTKGDGQVFNEGVVHIQPYAINKNGKLKRSSMQARLMTDEEIEKYGPIIHYFNPDVKFKP